MRKITATDQERNTTTVLAGVEKKIIGVSLTLGEAGVSGGPKLIILGDSP